MYRSPFYGWLRGTVAALLRRAVEGGDVRAVDVEYVADFLLAALNIDLYLYQRRELSMNRERVLGALEDLLDGLHSWCLRVPTLGRVGPVLRREGSDGTRRWPLV